MITQEEIEEYLALNKLYDLHEDTFAMMEIINETPSEDFKRFMELWYKLEKAAKTYVHAYFLANYKVRGIEEFDTGYYKTSWEDWNRYEFDGIYREKPTEHLMYDINKTYPEGYVDGHFLTRWSYEDERKGFRFSVNELFIDDPMTVLTVQYTAIMEEKERNQKAAHIADQKRREKLKYQQYLELKSEFEPEAEVIDALSGDIPNPS